MPDITDPLVEQYVYSLLPERDAVLQEMEAEAATRNIPIVGPAVGRALHQFARMIGARTVFEMGSAIGYSTIWWARAVGEQGRVFYTDGDRKNADQARRYFERAGVAGQIKILVGDALELLSGEKGPFDIIFNDVDKQDYPRIFRLAVPRLRQGGLFISDNVLWHGRVVEPLEPNDSGTRGILEFNQLLYASKELYPTILPLRDGLGVALKL
jgi:caffeoyl-CoA O-methyltransferase